MSLRVASIGSSHHAKTVIYQRISTIRPLRPPNPNRSLQRCFSSKPPFSFLARDNSRPTLPFLASRRASQPPFHLRFSTEQKQRFKHQVRLSILWTVNLWVLAGAFSVAYFWLREDWLDRLYPSPEEWGFMLKVRWREARHMQAEAAKYGQEASDWARMASDFQSVIVNVEQGTSAAFGQRVPLPQVTDWETYDFPGFDKDLVRREPDSSLGPSPISRIGFDVSSKPEEWRRCYFEALMGLTHGAELGDGCLFDKTTKTVYLKEQVASPSNPWPTRLGPGIEPPQAENCVPAFSDPSVYYVRILTTAGLSPGQRLDAGLAYASWLDHKGDSTTALELYHWCLDLACRTFSTRNSDIPIRSVVDSATGVVAAQAPTISRNLLKVNLALAHHHARRGEVSKSLAIYLSSLRAYRSSPLDRDGKIVDKPDLSLTTLKSITEWMSLWSTRPSIDPPPPSGDEPLVRDPNNVCEEATIMTHIGEIVFASGQDDRPTAAGVGKRKREGLGWTRDAVDIAEAGHGNPALSAGSRRACTQCLGVGLENWAKMMDVIASENMVVVSAEARRASDPSSWVSWLPWIHGRFSIEDVDAHSWESERQQVLQRRDKFREEQLMTLLNRQIQTKSSWISI